MAGIVLNIKVFSLLKLHSDLTGNCHAICHYLYNFPLGTIRSNLGKSMDFRKFEKNNIECTKHLK